MYSKSLNESSTPEKGKRRLRPRGPSANRYKRTDDREDTSNLIALRKAGFKTGKPNLNKDPKVTYNSNSSHHYTNVDSYKDQANYAIQSTEASPKYNKFDTFRKVRPTQTRVQLLKKERDLLKTTRTPRKVHDVNIYADDYYNKNYSKSLISRGKSFKKERDSVPKSVKKAGAKPGDFVVGHPAATMPNEDPKKGEKIRSRLYQKDHNVPVHKKTGKLVGRMKTFEEFISEKYYDPWKDKLPSGKTPIRKALDKSKTHKNPERKKILDAQMRRHVNYGADSKDYNDHSHPDLRVSKGSNYLNVHHKPSRINYRVTKIDNEHHIDWGHDHPSETMTNKDRIKIALTARRIYNDHVAHRLPYGAKVVNTPDKSYDDKGREIRNKRASLYQKQAGFGNLDSSGKQYGRVGRIPSSKRRAKGETRIKPINPEN